MASVAPAKVSNKFQNVLECIGNSPLIRLNVISKELNTNVWAKMESMNPGLSAKDRIALFMIEKAEEEGRLTKGGTIVEATSGNTGYSMAMISSIKGYKCILCVTSKISQAKKDSLEAMGAIVVVCPKEAKPDAPESYYETAKRIARETPNSLYLNQNFDEYNMMAHYHSTGPEIWEQTEGEITHYVCSTGTGGTMSGTAKYIKEQNPNVTMVGVDAYGSVLKKFWETGVYDKNEISSYRIEGTGKNIIPKNVKFEFIDEYTKVTDKSAALMARRLALEEGLMVGYSSGGNVQALYEMKHLFKPTDTVVVMICDHGSRYLGKIFNDDWMRDQGFID